MIFQHVTLLRHKLPVYTRIFMMLFFYSNYMLIAIGQQKTTIINGNKESSYARQVITHFFEQQASVRYIYGATLNSIATAIAWTADDAQGSQVIYRSNLSQPGTPIRITAALPGNKKYNETEPVWSPGGHEIAFLSDARSPGQLQLFIVNADDSTLVNAEPLSKFDGYVSCLKWSPDGKWLSVLYVEKASRTPSPMAAENKAVGLIDSILNKDVQHIAVINRVARKTTIISPAGLYVFEYDWSPDSKKFVYTAASPPGDDNWYIAQLYQQSVYIADTFLLYKPTRQIALPRWSPDGKQVAFIEGLMSDQGGTGGEIFVISSTGDGKPKNLTPGRASTPSWFVWRPGGGILFTEFVGGSVAVSKINTSNGIIQNLWNADESIWACSEEMSLSVAGSKTKPVAAFVRTSWNKLPEIYYGNFDTLTQLSHLNTALQHAVRKAANLEWMSDGQRVQGWLLYPADYDSSKQYPMLVSVHGDPAWITTPTWSSPDFNTTVYTQLGYFVFFPNPRGSYGQGESFTIANRRDWGFGDYRDIIIGVDTVIQKFPVNKHRVGILGWSYGGYMAMFSVTQTNSFSAAVAGAGACDWLSYYGQNSIDKWMWSYFGTSPYHDPAPYTRCSAITYVKQVKTPTLILVGERDGEAPAPQSFQYWHALKELQVPTQLMVYPDEGHSFEKFENMVDVSVRTIEWFNKYMATEEKL